MFGLRIFLIYPYTDSRCYVDTKEFFDAFKFDTKLVYAVLVVSCYKDYEVYFTEDDSPFSPDVVSYVQIMTCKISQEQLYPIQNRFKIFMITYDAKYLPLDMKHCDGESVNRNSSKVWNTLKGIMCMPHKLTDFLTSIRELFHCNKTLPDMKEISLV